MCVCVCVGGGITFSSEIDERELSPDNANFVLVAIEGRVTHKGRGTGIIVVKTLEL